MLRHEKRLRASHRALTTSPHLLTPAASRVAHEMEFRYAVVLAGKICAISSAELANYVRQNCHNGLARRDALREPHRESYRAGQRAGGVTTRRQRFMHHMERAGPLGRSDSATSTAIRGQRQNRRRTPETRASRGIACSPPPGETIAARAGASSALRPPKIVIMGTSGRPTPVGGCRPAARHSLGACSSGPAKRCAPRRGR